MTAFLFIPSATQSRHVHRVDFANIGRLFNEAEDPAPLRSSLRSRAIRVTAFAVILVALVGDMVFVARPAMVANAFITHGILAGVVS